MEFKYGLCFVVFSSSLLLGTLQCDPKGRDLKIPFKASSVNHEITPHFHITKSVVERSPLGDILDVLLGKLAFLKEFISYRAIIG